MGIAQSKRLQGRKGCESSGNSSSNSSSFSDSTNVNRHLQKPCAKNDNLVNSSRHQNIVSMFSSSSKSPSATVGVSPRRNLYSSNSLPRNVSMQRSPDDDSSLFVSTRKYSVSMLQAQSTIPAQRTENYIGVESTSRFLPDDWDSQDRDLALHIALKRLLGGNILPAVQELLQHNITVVDLGCFNGAWLMDMAPQYRDCKFIGIEASTASLVIPQLLSIPNVRLEMASPTAPFVPLADASVEVCCLRAQSLNFQLDDWEHMLNESFRILKPGGVLQVVEAYYSMEGTVLIESFFHTVHKLLKDENIDVAIALKLRDLLTMAGFEIVNSERKTVHLGSDGRTGNDFVAVSLHAFERIRGLLADKMGLDNDEYQQRVEMVCAQCVQRDVSHYWYAYAARKPMTCPP